MNQFLWGDDNKCQGLQVPQAGDLREGGRACGRQWTPEDQSPLFSTALTSVLSLLGLSLELPHLPATFLEQLGISF